MADGIGDLTFATPEWVDAARDALTAAAARHAEGLGDLGTFTLCEVAHNPPAFLHLRPPALWPCLAADLPHHPGVQALVVARRVGLPHHELQEHAQRPWWCAAARLRVILAGMRAEARHGCGCRGARHLAAVTGAAQRSTATVVYEAVAPAVVFVETEGATGSGLLLESRTILTAAHVVYPHRSARIVFPHGTELLDAPLIGWDLMADV